MGKLGTALGRQVRVDAASDACRIAGSVRVGRGSTEPLKLKDVCHTKQLSLKRGCARRALSAREGMGGWEGGCVGRVGRVDGWLGWGGVGWGEVG